MKGKVRIGLILIMGLGILILGYCFLAIENQTGSVSARKKEETKKEPEVLRNCCILSVDADEIRFLHGTSRYVCELKDAEATATDLVGELVDITLRGNEIEQILVKQEVIAVEHFTYQLDENGLGNVQIGDEKYRMTVDFEAYDCGSEKAVAPAELAGYGTVRFVVKDGEIVGAFAEKSQVPNIRVVLMNTGFLAHTHENVTVSSAEPMQITMVKKSGGEEHQMLPAGEKWELKKEDAMEWERVILEPENGKFRVESIKRKGEAPEYEGVLEVVPGSEGLYLINELPVERYLMGVLPSEVPSTYDMEAIKAQAICARSYAFAALDSPKFPDLQAHVDDSTGSQVYMNTKITAEAERAVAETTGQTLWCGDKLGKAYYYSTSCGVGADITEVWGESEKDYLVTELHVPWEKTSAMVAKLLGNLDVNERGELERSVDLSKESTFREFLESNLVTVSYENLTIQEEMQPYEQEYLWYRWEMEVPIEKLTEAVNDNLKFCSAQLGTNVKITDTEGKESKETSIGSIKNITITKRGKSGIVTELQITGSKGTAILTRQTAIRTILAMQNEKIYRTDGKAVSGYRLLPSAFIYVDIEDGVATIKGGGYGHGVGMSQNGANEMAQNGLSCEEILLHFFPGTTIRCQYGM